MLALEISFLTGRYVATEYNDRTRAEWPPHPARVFSALVAAQASEAVQEERDALLWLEKQGAPEIAASSAFEREVATVFVPVNDKPGFEDGRVKQPRTFPSSTPEDPRVVMVWPHAEPSRLNAEALDQVCAKVVRIGHSSSLASVRVVPVAPKTTWKPSETGEHWLRVVREGQLAQLDRAYELHRETESGRVMPTAFQRYSDRENPRVERPPASEFGEEWLLFRHSDARGVPRLPAVAGPALAGTVRRALMNFAEQPVSPVISGHPTDKTHLAVVPLPFVGYEHADGRIMGFGLVLPRDVNTDERTTVYRAVDAWEKNLGGDREIVVHLGRLGSLRFERLELEPGPASLRVAMWSAPSRTWMTATPVALDRNPGDLHSRDARAAARAYIEAEETVNRACERILLPRPTEVTILPAAPLAGAPKARAYGGFPSQRGKTKRVLTHVRISFGARVRGPVLLGAGRYAGLGLFRPVGD